MCSSILIMQKNNFPLNMSEYKKTNGHISVCSANYFRINKILSVSKKDLFVLRNKINETAYSAQIKKKKLSNHTWMCSLNFSNLEHKLLHSLEFNLNIYHDAELCEVSSFNGYAPSKFPFSKESFPKSSDEKLQQNRFLTEVLDIILTSGFYEQ